MSEENKKVIELVLANVRIVGFGMLGCSECPFSKPSEDSFGNTDVNISDPDEGHYDCVLLRRENIWGENPECKDPDWVNYVRSLLVKLPTEDKIREWIARDLNYLNPEVAPFIYMGIEALYVKLGGKRFIKVRMPQRQ